MKTEKRVQARGRVRVRIRQKVRGSEERPRLAVFKSGRHIYAQVIDDASGRTLAHASSLDAGLRKDGKTGANVGTAKRVGKLVADRAREKGIARVVFDRNGLEPPELQVRLDTAGGIYRADFYWWKYRTIGEADGLQKYDSKTKAIEQLSRDQFLRETGRHVVHFTWREVFYQESRLIGRLTSTFATPPPPARQWE